MQPLVMRLGSQSFHCNSCLGSITARASHYLLVAKLLPCRRTIIYFLPPCPGHACHRFSGMLIIVQKESEKALYVPVHFHGSIHQSFELCKCHWAEEPWLRGTITLSSSLHTYVPCPVFQAWFSLTCVGKGGKWRVRFCTASSSRFYFIAFIAFIISHLFSKEIKVALFLLVFSLQ